MPNLLLTALVIALIYYAFFYRPIPKPLPPPTLTDQFTQTEPNPVDPELESTLDNLIQEIKQLCSKIN